MCKVMERIAKGTILEHLSEYNNGNQHRYTRGRSCLTDLLELFKEVYETIDEGKLKGGTCLEFAKEFAKVPHKRLAKCCKQVALEGRY